MTHACAALLLVGVGQHVVADEEALDAAIDGRDAGELHEHGAVIEQNVEHARTLCVDTVSVPGLQIACHGMQRATRHHRGRDVHGGADLEIVPAHGAGAGTARPNAAGIVAAPCAAG